MKMLPYVPISNDVHLRISDIAALVEAINFFRYWLFSLNAIKQRLDKSLHEQIR